MCLWLWLAARIPFRERSSRDTRSADVFDFEQVNLSVVSDASDCAGGYVRPLHISWMQSIRLLGRGSAFRFLLRLTVSERKIRQFQISVVGLANRVVDDDLGRTSLVFSEEVVIDPQSEFVVAAGFVYGAFRPRLAFLNVLPGHGETTVNSSSDCSIVTLMFDSDAAPAPYA